MNLHLFKNFFMKKMTIALAVVLSTGALYSCGDTAEKKDSVEAADSSNDAKQDVATTPVKEDDSEFMTFAADAGMTEVEAGKAAQAKTTNAKVKAFAADMIKDHTAAGNDLKSLAANKNITLPTAISEDHQKAISEVGAKTGVDFDKAYVDMMVDDHQKVVDKFEDASKNAKDADVKAFATKTLPTLQAHLEHAKMLKDGMK
jgi:putative membrane protein